MFNTHVLCIDCEHWHGFQVRSEEQKQSSWPRGSYPWGEGGYTEEVDTQICVWVFNTVSAMKESLPVESLEKAMTIHSSTLAWKIPWTEGPGRLQSMGSLRVGHDWMTSLSLFTFMHGRRKWQPAPMFLPGESQGQGSLVGCRLWGRTESDTTEAT